MAAKEPAMKAMNLGISELTPASPGTCVAWGPNGPLSKRLEGEAQMMVLDRRWKKQGGKAQISRKE